MVSRVFLGTCQQLSRLYVNVVYLRQPAASNVHLIAPDMFEDPESKNCVPSQFHDLIDKEEAYETVFPPESESEQPALTMFKVRKTPVTDVIETYPISDSSSEIAVQFVSAGVNCSSLPPIPVPEEHPPYWEPAPTQAVVVDRDNDYWQPILEVVAAAASACESETGPIGPLFSLYPRNERGWPTLSDSGRYVVRLWVFGQWRMVCIDSRVPLDQSGTSLLPYCANAAELGYFLLCKALSKCISTLGLTSEISQHPDIVATMLLGTVARVENVSISAIGTWKAWDLCRYRQNGETFGPVYGKTAATDCILQDPGEEMSLAHTWSTSCLDVGLVQHVDGHWGALALLQEATTGEVAEDFLVCFRNGQHQQFSRLQLMNNVQKVLFFLASEGRKHPWASSTPLTEADFANDATDAPALYFEKCESDRHLQFIVYCAHGSSIPREAEIPAPEIKLSLHSAVCPLLGEESRAELNLRTSFVQSCPLFVPRNMELTLAVHVASTPNAIFHIAVAGAVKEELPVSLTVSQVLLQRLGYKVLDIPVTIPPAVTGQNAPPWQLIASAVLNSSNGENGRKPLIIIPTLGPTSNASKQSLVTESTLCLSLSHLGNDNRLASHTYALCDVGKSLFVPLSKFEKAFLSLESMGSLQVPAGSTFSLKIYIWGEIIGAVVPTPKRVELSGVCHRNQANRACRLIAKPQAEAKTGNILPNSSIALRTFTTSQHPLKACIASHGEGESGGQDISVGEKYFASPSFHLLPLPRAMEVDIQLQDGPLKEGEMWYVVAFTDGTLVEDTSERDATTAMKSKWEASDPGRAAKAKAKREEFLAAREKEQQPRLLPGFSTLSIENHSPDIHSLTPSELEDQKERRKHELERALTRHALYHDGRKKVWQDWKLMWEQAIQQEVEARRSRSRW
jgi:hypothetical protein